MPDVDRDHIRRMRDTAEGFLADGDHLSQYPFSRSDAQYLLRLIGFEILLKATLYLHGRIPAKNHRYDALFAALPAEAQVRLLRGARNRVGSLKGFDDLPGLLGTLGRNFVALRYPFSAYEGMTDGDVAASADRWIDEGAPDSSATFVYWPEELFGLTEAFRLELTSVLDPPV
jgi:hypothetical protein